MAKRTAKRNMRLNRGRALTIPARLGESVAAEREQLNCTNVYVGSARPNLGEKGDRR